MASDPRSKLPQSHIPVMTPRPSQSTLPSSLSTPHLGLVPPTRHLAVSGSPTHPSASSPTASSSSGLTPFRSFRNLLSFGPGKNNTLSSPPSALANPRPPFSNLRRSIHGDRSVSAPHLPHPRSQEDLPVLAIELTHRIDEPLFNKEEQTRLWLEPRTPEAVSPASSCASMQIVDPPAAFGASDLSTILEAETSGISKHVPNLDESLDVPSSRSAGSRVSPKTISARPLQRSSSDPTESSVLDLSTSNVSNEVLAALSASGRKDGWLNGIIVEDGDSHNVDNRSADPNGSFDLDALDPDLAALLNTNGIKGPSPPLLTPPLTEPRRNSRSPSPRSTLKDLPSHRSPSSGAPSPVLATHVASSSTSPLLRSTSLSKQSSTRLAPPSSLARLTRSASEKPSYFQSSRSPLPSPTSVEPVGRQSLQLPRKTQSPLLSEAALPKRPTSSGGDESESRKPALSKLTPSRNLAASNARGALRILPSPSSSPGWDGSESVSSRSPSAYGSASTRRVTAHRPSLDTGLDRPHMRTRDRSTSLTESTQYHPSTIRGNDWLGPRTAKAFAAAGLLDGDKGREPAGPAPSRPGSRFGFGTVRSERDFRSQYAPSRAGFSEVGSSSSWGRRSGSISHTVASSELGTPFSESVATTPRTTYSAASTAPTSISATSSVQKHLQSELHNLQERHSTETGALLNALSDSQRTTRMLREENAQLRERIQYLEDELADAQDMLHKIQFTPPNATSTLPRSNFYRLMGRNNPDSQRRPLPHSRLQTLLHPDENEQNADNEASQDADHEPMPMPSQSSHETASQTSSRRKRYSNNSSIFPAPPSNMPMLLHEDGGSSEHAAAFSTRSMTPSPTLHTAKLPHAQSQVSYTGHHRTSSSAGNISPTTANFSMITGSPGSLYLRPEHERLLGDMPTLDLCAEDYESVHGFLSHRT